MDVRSNVYERRSLGDVCTLQRGFDLPTKNRNPGEYALVTSSGPTDMHDEARVTGPGVVTGRSGSIGNVFFIEGDFWPLNTTLYVKDFHGNDERYVFYLLQYFDLGKFASGAGVPTLNRNHVHSESVQVACNLDEQKRIVALLDQAFAALDRARAHVEANLADAIELKNCCVESALSSNMLGELESVGPHVNLLTGFAFKSGGYTEGPEDIRLVRGDNIVQGEFRWDGVKRWPVSDRANYEKYELARDDVLIAMDRTWISAGIKYAIVDEAALPSLLVQRVARLRSKPSLLPRYLAYWIGSKFFERYVLSIQTGLGVPHVSGSQIENFLIRVPSISEQEAVLDRLDRIMERQDSLVFAYRRKLADLADLRQSLLQKAFSGNLMPD